MIKVEGVCKEFGDNMVLDRVSAQFEPGICSLIIGASGSGKTTLIKCMVGLYPPDSGSVEYDGRDFYSLTGKQQLALRREIGMLFQGGALFDSKTVEENVGFPLDMFSKMSRGEKKDRINFCLEKVNLSGKNRLYPSELSGGMKKRVGIARALSLEPRYLYCDEPNSGLDPKTSLVIDELILRLTHDLNITTIINTHDMNSVLEIGEKVIFLYQGKKWWEGSRTEIMNSSNQELQDFVFANRVLQDKKTAKIR